MLALETGACDTKRPEETSTCALDRTEPVFRFTRAGGRDSQGVEADLIDVLCSCPGPRPSMIALVESSRSCVRAW
jgi:hypothetical protein